MVRPADADVHLGASGPGAARGADPRVRTTTTWDTSWRWQRREDVLKDIRTHTWNAVTDTIRVSVDKPLNKIAAALSSSCAESYMYREASLATQPLAAHLTTREAYFKEIYRKYADDNAAEVNEGLAQVKPPALPQADWDALIA